MRASLMFRTLFLFCVLAAADAAACDRSLITGSDEIEYYDNDGPMELRCRSAGEIIKAIVFNSKPYSFLTCNETGWFDGDQRISEAASQLSVNCVEYCAIAETVSNTINVEVAYKGRVQGTKIEYKGRNYEFVKHLRCNGFYGLFHDGRLVTSHVYDAARLRIDKSQPARYAICDKRWYTGIAYVNEITNDTWTPQQFECLPVCSLGERSTDLIVTNSAKNPLERFTFKCNNQNHGILLNERSSFPEIKCTYADGYTADNRGKVADSFDRVNLSCVARCDRSLINGPNEIEFNSTTKMLSCPSDEKNLRAIVFNSKRYESLICDEHNGWRDGGWRAPHDKIVAYAWSPMDVTCVEYCSTIEVISNGSKIDVFFSEDINRKQILCRGIKDHTADKYGLFYGGRFMKRNYAQCELGKWYSDYHEDELTNDTSTPQRFECLPACTIGERSTGVSVVTLDKSKGKTMFECNKMDGKNYGILINETFPIYSQIKCSQSDGYTVASGSKLTGAFNRVDLSCVIDAPYPCTLPSTKGIKFDNVTLTCANEAKEIPNISQGLMGINVGSERYDSITCDEKEGWKDGRKIIWAHVSPLPATCVQYCAATGTGEVNFRRFYDAIYVNCTSSSMKLFYGEKHIRGKALCVLGGWSDDSERNSVFREDTTTSAHFECREGATSSDATSSLTISTTTLTTNSESEEFEESAATSELPLVIGCSVIGVMAACMVAGFAIFLFKRKRQQEARDKSADSETNKKAKESGRSSRKTTIKSESGRSSKKTSRNSDSGRSGSKSRSEKISKENYSEARSEL